MALKHSGKLLLVLAVLTALFCVGLYQLFSLRFRAGDIYPEYSSLRADPQGTKILFQSLEKLPQLEVTRLLKPLDDKNAEHVSVLVLGSGYNLVRRNDDELRSFIHAGGRAVIAYAPVEPRFRPRYERVADEEADEEELEQTDGESGLDADDVPECSETNLCAECASCVKDKWQFSIEQFTRKEMGELEKQEHALPEVGEALNPVPWKSAYWFDELGEDWTVLYRYLGKPVLIERAWENGSVVLAADSYFFSNEAMVMDRQTALLIRLLGASSTVLFDEVHLGVQSREGVMMLVNRYRMQGLLLAMFIFAMLFIWQRTTSFVPRHEEDDAAAGDIGTNVGSLDGFTNLLARHIPQKQIMETMMKEWRSTLRNRPMLQGRKERVEKEMRRLIASDSKIHPVDLYNRLTQIWNERK